MKKWRGGGSLAVICSFLLLLLRQHYLPIVAKDDNTDVVRLQVEGHTLDSRLEFHHLTGLHLGEAEDSGDTITDGDDGSELLEIVLLTTVHGATLESCMQKPKYTSNNDCSIE